jgi:hypothetical protein
MSVPITNFLNKVVSDAGVRTTNMWEVELNTGISDVDKVFEDFTCYAQGFQLPKMDMQYGNLPFRGVNIPIPLNPTPSQDISIKMWADTEGKVQQALRTWLNSIIDQDFQAGSYLGGSRRLNTSSTMRLHLLDDDMQTITETVTLHCVSIKSVGSIEFTHESASVCYFTNEFKYAWPSFE